MSESRSPGTMPEASTPPAPPASPTPTTGLASQIATATVTTPGVARLVPGLKGALARLRRSDAGDVRGDGVTVVREGDGIRVVIDIGVHPEAVVVDTARAVRAAAQDVVGSAHDGPSVVRVNVLAWEPEQSQDQPGR